MPPSFRSRLIALGRISIGASLVVVLVLLGSPFGQPSPPAPPEALSRHPLAASPSLSTAKPLIPPPPVVYSEELASENSHQPAPEPERCEPTAGSEHLAEAQILSYYGNPYSAKMGILGELPPEALVEKLQAHAERYDSLNGPRSIQPALHMVYATAHTEPGPQGIYLQYVDEGTLQQYIDLACDKGLLIFLDLQIGRSDVESELTKILSYLEQPHVHAALDPEFAMPAGEVPGERIGSLDAADVNAAQALLQNFVEEHGLPDKILIVHQFIHAMLTRPELIEDYPRVRLVVDMDGFGPSDVKRVKYRWFTASAEYSGLKLFFRYDTDLMSEQEVLELEPDVIIYQ